MRKLWELWNYGAGLSISTQLLKNP